jgi:hypothetical protein
MRSFLESKPWVLLVSILALGALTVLSVSLKNVSFNKPQPIGLKEAASSGESTAVVDAPSWDIPIGSQIFVWMVLVILVALVAMLLSPEARKKLIRLFIRVAFFYWVVYFLLERYPKVLSAFNLNSDDALIGRQTGSPAEIPPPVFVPPQNSPLLSYAISMLIVLAVIYFGWRLVRAWRELNPSKVQRPMDEIAKIARSSLRDLSSGRESTDVILKCYFRMNDVVAEKKKVHRDLSVTPAEFATRLERSGLPSDAVRRLTRLFESARYGSRKMEPKDINEAVACLTAILHYCGEVV